MRNELIRYVKRNCTVEVMYLSKSNNVSKRTVSIIKINSASFLAYCHLKQAKRLFKFDKLLAVFPILRTVDSVG